MKTVLIFNQFNCQGAERISILYAKILERHGFKCDILQLGKTSDSNKLLPFIPKSMQRYELRYNRWRDSFSLIYNFLKNHHYDIVLCSFGSLGGQLGLIKFFTGLNFKYVVRFCNNPETLKGVGKLMCSFFLRKANLIIAQTDDMENRIKKMFPSVKKKCITINNPVDKDLIDKCIAEQYIMDDSLINYVSVGKVIPRKGFDTLVKAFNIVVKNQPNSRLYIVGDYTDKVCTDFKMKLDNMIDNFGLSDKVFFVGFQTNPFKFISSCNAFILASIDEGLPNVILESLYIGKPVVATQSVPFVSQIIKDGNNGYSLSIGDFERMAECMINVLKIKVPRYTTVIDSERLLVKTFETILNIKDAEFCEPFVGKK